MYKKNSSAKILYLSFIFSIIIWLIFTWPLSKNLTSGIPASAHNQEKNATRYMIAGDHLQLAYHFWLLSDMIQGKTPFFSNIYEFNTGNDKERLKFSFYYIPFSLLFTILQFIAGRAFGWNISSFLAIFLTYYFSILLALRYTKNLSIGFVCALFSILLPYRWISILGGSPAGFGMTFVPLIFLGIEIAFSEQSIKGGILSGIGVLLAYFSDTHVFFFSVLSIPIVCILSIIKNSNYFLNDKTKTFNQKLLKVISSISPLILLTILSISLSFILKKRLSSSMMSGGRTFDELALFSPKWNGLFLYESSELNSNIFIGFCFILILIIGGIVLFKKLQKNKKEYFLSVVLSILLVLIITGIIFLALGVNGPKNGIFVRAFRKFFSPYAMIRQSSKIYSIIPSFMVMLSVILLDNFFKILKQKASKIYFLIGLVVFMMAEYKNKVEPSICLIEKNELSYEAVSLDSLKEGKNPHVLILPLWPGDSAWASLYEYYVSLYRIRMVNGYSPVVTKKYVDEIFQDLNNINKGDLSLIEVNKLKEMGVNYIILHEDAFPEKVSPFPVCFTLQRLLKNPYLKLLRNNGPVWAFKILEESVIKDETSNWNVFFPVRKYEMEKCKGENVFKVNNQNASSFEYIELNNKGSYIVTGGFSIPNTLNQKWVLRVRGNGEIKTFIEGSLKNNILSEKINNPMWHYITFPLNEIADQRTSLKIELIEGNVDIDIAFFMAGEWEFNNTISKVMLEAPLFFHAGFIDIAKNSVTFTKNKVNAIPFKLDNDTALNLTRHKHSVLYGPYLPISDGKYKIVLNYNSFCRNKELLGYVYFTFDNKNNNFMEILAGEKVESIIEVKNNLPFTMNFIYAGDYDITINNLTIEKIN